MLVCVIKDNMIEDIEYLNDNCEKDAVTFYVDTKTRNREIYPLSAEFCVDFEQPFKLVNGFDILDAAIPTTMYNVDVYDKYNALSMVMVPPLVTYDRKLYFKELRCSRIFSNIFEIKVDTTYVLVCDESVLSSISQNNSPINNDTIIDSVFHIAVRRVISSPPVFKKQSNMKLGYFHFTFDDIDYCIQLHETNQTLIDVIENGNFYLNEDGNVVFFQFYKTDETIHDTITTSSAYTILIANYWKAIEEGNYDINTLRNELNQLWNDYNIYWENTSTIDRQKGKYRLFSPELIIYNAKKSTMSISTGFDLLPVSTNVDHYETYKIKENNEIFVSNYNTDDRFYYIFAPGLVNLLGERFVILRCKEIEDHLLGSFAYMQSTPGIGLFKLAASYNDITNLRFDFVNLVRKPFHPIGKLHKLTFRFETASGRLYDFKGVNIQMLFMIKFLVPTQKFKFPKSILNPNYDPDFMKYMATHKTIQYREDSDEEEEFDTQNYYQEYKKELEKYDYSSSGESHVDTEDDTSDEDED